MPSTYTTSGIELIGDGEQSGSWGGTTNGNLQILDRMISQAGTISLSGTTHTLTVSDGTLSDGQYAVLVFGGSPSGTNTVTISPNDAKRVYFVKNSSGQSVTLTQGSGGNVTVADGGVSIVYCDGAGAGAEVVDISGLTSNDIGVTVQAYSSALQNTTASFTTADETKLDGIETGADVTDATNVAAAGAVMDSDIGSTVQAYDAGLADIASLAVTDGNFIVGNGTNWVAESGNTVLTSMGVTATAAELNLLDGLTSTAAELNLLDGLTGKTGADLSIVTGTAGTDGNLSQWNADGDLVDGPDVLDEDDMSSDSDTAVPTQQSVKAYVDALPFSESFVSAEQTITKGGTLTLAHGLSGQPTLIQAWLVCKTSDNGYSPGDRIISHMTNEGQDGGDSRGIGVYLEDSTNIGIIYGSADQQIVSKTTGAKVSIDSSDWRFVVYAWR